ncbi:MAG: hypothetical protein KDK72_09575, partial [Chlamydiia bacterium]|nr:hypothetical protein [Chlamydiia bacterium]
INFKEEKGPQKTLIDTYGKLIRGHLKKSCFKDKEIKRHVREGKRVLDQILSNYAARLWEERLIDLSNADAPHSLCLWILMRMSTIGVRSLYRLQLKKLCQKRVWRKYITTICVLQKELPESEESLMLKRLLPQLK